VKCRVPGGAFYAWPNVTEACAWSAPGFRGTQTAPAQRGRRRGVADIHSARASPAKGSMCASLRRVNQAIEGGRRAHGGFHPQEHPQGGLKRKTLSVWKPSATVAAVIERGG